MSDRGRPLSAGISVNRSCARGVNNLMREARSRKIVPISVELTRFCMSSFACVFVDLDLQFLIDRATAPRSAIAVPPCSSRAPRRRSVTPRSSPAALRSTPSAPPPASRTARRCFAVALSGATTLLRADGRWLVALTDARAAPGAASVASLLEDDEEEAARRVILPQDWPYDDVQSCTCRSSLITRPAPRRSSAFARPGTTPSAIPNEVPAESPSADCGMARPR